MAIYNFGMKGKEHLVYHLIGGLDAIAEDKLQAYIKIIDWVTDKGLDIVEVYDELRLLLDLPKPRVECSKTINYTSSYHWDEKLEMFVGEIENKGKVYKFQGKTMSEMEQSFEEAAYLIYLSNNF
jgi:hypothetical protein